MSVPPESKLRRDMNEIETAQAIARTQDRATLGNGATAGHMGYPGLDGYWCNVRGILLEYSNRWLFWTWKALDQGKPGKDVTPDWLGTIETVEQIRARHEVTA